MTNELGAEARALIDQACRQELPPGSAELERIRRNVVGGAVSSAVMLAAPHAAGFAGATTPLALVALALKGAAAGTLVALTAFGANRYLFDPAPPRDSARYDARLSPVPVEPTQVTRPPVAPSALPPADAARASDARVVSAPVGVARPAATSFADGSSRAPSGVSSSSLEASAALHEEAVLLQRVQQELRAGRGAEALRLLDASSERLERGQLRQERLAAEVLAACQTGDRARALQSARAFAAENPATPSAARLRGSCVGAEVFGEE